MTDDNQLGLVRTNHCPNCEALRAEKQTARMEERAAIIAWLEKESTLCDCAAIYDGECVCGALDECKTVPIERILLAIEAGKHLK